MKEIRPESTLIRDRALNHQNTSGQVLPDYHVHTKYCGHATGEMEEYLQAAVERGLAEMGFSDHLPTFYLPDDNPYRFLLGELKDFEPYTTQFAEIASDMKGIDMKLRFASEIDYFPEKHKEIAAALSMFPFDYVIGSVHFVGRFSIYDKEFYRNADERRIFEDYFETVAAAARSGLFDIIGHLDVPKIYCRRISSEEIADLAEPALLAIKEAGVAVEVNTSGYRLGVGEPFPGSLLLSRCIEMGIPLSTGSDAHKPEQVALEFERLHGLLLDLGVSAVSTFKGRRRVPLPIA